MGLVRRTVILFKAETVYAVDSVPTPAANAVLVEAPAFTLNPEFATREPVKETVGTLKPIFAGMLAEVTFDAEIKGSGVNDVAPEIGTLLQACGLSETKNTGVSTVYDPASGDSVISGTLYYFEDGKRRIMRGCRGNVKITIAKGDKLMASFRFVGHIDPDTDTALPSPTFDTTVPVGLIGVPFTVGGFGATITSVEFDLQNNVAAPGDISAADGFGEVRLTERNVIGSFDPEAVLVATQDFIADLKAGTNKIIDTGVIGSASGNRVQFVLNQVVYKNLSLAERESVQTYDIPFDAAETVSGDDEFQITFT